MSRTKCDTIGCKTRTEREWNEELGGVFCAKCTKALEVDRLMVLLHTPFVLSDWEMALAVQNDDEKAEEYKAILRSRI